MGNQIGRLKVAARKIGISLDEYMERKASGLKWCFACSAWHPQSEFGPDSSRGDGLSAKCSTVIRRKQEQHRAGAERRYRNKKLARFENNFIGDPNSGCWLWLASYDENGYGRFKFLGDVVASRVAYRLYVGDIPEGLCVLHKCDTPACVRPDHLFLGTLAVNNADRAEKGRSSRGENHCHAKLSEAQVLEIRSSRHHSPATLARRYGVSPGAIYHIWGGESWGWLK